MKYVSEFNVEYETLKPKIKLELKLASITAI
jgi:hypothetical protein